ncbi:MAG: class I tRNA ligase family protein [Nitrososphaeria archaeon]
MSMNIFTTNKRSVVELKPRLHNHFLIQVCGPTLYDGLHLGHVRTFLFFDVLARFLKHSGYKVSFSINFTDIDEEVFYKARKEGTSFEAVSNKFCTLTLNTFKVLNIKTPTNYPRSSESVEKSIEIIKSLILNGFAYELNGNVFFEFDKLYDKGPVSSLSKEILLDLRLDSYKGKRGPLDFLLWYKTDRHPNWPSPWSSGRPGWHLQDVVMANAVFNGPHDLHGGAVELIYPHHDFIECLGRAVESVNPYVPYWVHTCILLIGGKKMSKSEGNVIYVDDLLKKFSSESIRTYFLSTNREMVIDFEEDNLIKYDEMIKSLRMELDKCKGGYSPPSKDVLVLKRSIIESLSENMNTNKALELCIQMVQLVKEGGINVEVVKEIFQILGLDYLLL